MRKLMSHVMLLMLIISTPKHFYQIMTIILIKIWLFDATFVRNMCFIIVFKVILSKEEAVGAGSVSSPPCH